MFPHLQYLGHPPVQWNVQKPIKMPVGSHPSALADVALWHGFMRNQPFERAYGFVVPHELQSKRLNTRPHSKNTRPSLW